jgi:tRNA nucleotidyltransferase/poly(A) polymerase
MRLLLLSVCLFLSSCYTQQKATNQISKANEKFPEVVSKQMALLYPCKPIKAVSDSSKYKLWKKKLDSLNSLKIDSILITDTCYLFDTVVKNKLVTDCERIVTKYREIIKSLPAIHDTIIQIDSANVFTLTYQRDSALLDKSKMEVRYKVFRKISIFLFLFIVALLLLYASKQKLY